MKINNIGLDKNPQLSQPKIEKNKQESRFINPNEVFKSFDVSAKSFISFRGHAVAGQEVDENRFMLPHGASPDQYQKIAATELNAGKDVLVTMPTGMGKTAIAQYIITKNFNEGKRTFYTTPLKALSNQKYKDFQKLYGEDNVGLLTGDVKIRPDADIVVMTTEVYRNQVFSEKLRDDSGHNQLRGLKTVVFDEMHYMGDPERGATWETSVIFTPKDVQILALSATVGNKEDLNGWISSIRSQDCSLVNVPPKARPVPLEYEDVFFSNEEPSENNIRNRRGRDSSSPSKKKLEPQNYMQMVEELKQKDRLPAIFFVFSKKKSKQLLSGFGSSAAALTSMAEQEQIKESINKHRNEGKYLGKNFDLKALVKGYSIHNSSLMPSEKELVEELFKKKLLKVVFATETLAAGINMPARTTVITSYEKPNDESKMRDLTVNEFHQMAGRAGRRGMDKKGYVYTMSVDPEQSEMFKSLFNSQPNDLKSHFNPDFSFIAEYYKNTTDDGQMENLLSNSFYAYDAESLQNSNEKAQRIIGTFKNNVGILKSFKYLNSDKTLTVKGQMLSKLNGYEQIPVIEMISGKKLPLEPMALAACVGAMASTNVSNAAKQERAKEHRSQGDSTESVIEELQKGGNKTQSIIKFDSDFDSSLRNYTRQLVELGKHRQVAPDKTVLKHLYKWADANLKSDDTIKNWENLCAAESATDESGRFDEGTLFKEVAQTIDLLKQIGNIAKVGKEMSTNRDDSTYFHKLGIAAKKAVELLNQEPVKDSTI